MLRASLRMSRSGTCSRASPIRYSFVANDPGAFMFHCGTKPVLAHIANGMYGAIIVEPQHAASERRQELRPRPHPSGTSTLRAASRSRPDSRHGEGAEARARLGDMERLRRPIPVTHPLTARSGSDGALLGSSTQGRASTRTSTSWGLILNRAWINADMTQFQRNIQTALVPAGGGAGVRREDPQRPACIQSSAHSFASVDLGQVGVLSRSAT